jgi:alpha-1,6-mannosyltransferase
VATADALGRRRAGWLSPPVALVAGAGAFALLGLAIGAAWPESSPLSPDHAGGDEGWSWLYLGAMSASFVLYLLGLAALARRGARLGAVVVVAAAIQLAPLAAPLLLSTDAYTYWARGRVAAVHGENPYETAPSAFPGDPALERMGRSWRDRPTGYGPAFTLLSEGHAAAVGDSPDAAAWTYRVVAAGAMLALVGLAAALGREKAFAAAFVGWNPLLAVQFAGGGHNDAVMMALVLGALLLGSRGHPRLAGVAWAGAILIKWVPVVFLPLRALEARRVGRRVDHVGFALAAALIVGVSFWRYGTGWLHSFGNFSGQLERTTSVSAARWLTGIGLSEDAAVALLIALFGVGYLWLLREAWRGRARLGLCGGLLVVTASWLVPWYAVWAVPLAAIEEDRTARLLALALSSYLLRAAVPL